MPAGSGDWLGSRLPGAERGGADSRQPALAAMAAKTHKLEYVRSCDLKIPVKVQV